MPTGFPDIASGSNLSPKLLPVLEELRQLFWTWRCNGTATPDSPIKSEAIRYQLKFITGKMIADATVRALVNALRQQREPIASTAHGYFYALNREELAMTKQHMHERIAAMSRALTGLERAEPRRTGQMQLL